MSQHPFESLTLFTCLEKIADDLSTSGDLLSQVDRDNAFKSSRWAANRLHDVSNHLKWIIANRDKLIISEINEIDTTKDEEL